MTEQNMTQYEIELVAIADLKPHPRNYQEHPDDQIEHIQNLSTKEATRIITCIKAGAILGVLLLVLFLYKPVCKNWEHYDKIITILGLVLVAITAILGIKREEIFGLLYSFLYEWRSKANKQKTNFDKLVKNLAVERDTE